MTNRTGAASTPASPAPARKRLTPTERKIIAYVAEHEGTSCSKADIARALGRHQKTVDRLMSELRAQGLVVSEAVWGPDGRQLANTYRLGREGGAK